MAGSQLEAVSAEVFTSRITSRNVTIRKPEACPEARYKVYPGSTYHLFATKQIGTGGLSPISYWHGFLDMIFFFKVVTGTVRVSPSVVLPQVLVTRTTRSNSNRNFSHFISRKCNTVTFQRSFFNRTTRIWNTLANELQLSYNLQISQFKSIMYQYHVDALELLRPREPTILEKRLSVM